MSVATNGKAFVYAVFDADGYECKSFCGAFSTQEKAEQSAAQLREAARIEFEGIKERHGFSGEDSRKISVESIELDQDIA